MEVKTFLECMLIFWVIDGLLVCSCTSFSGFETNLAWQKNVWRQEQLQSICNKKGTDLKKLPPLAQLDHLLVDHKHQVIYCYVPKVACTNWKRLLMVLSGRWNSTDLLSIPGDTAHAQGSVTRISDLPEAEALKSLNNYMLFLIVRHPFERLLSAYRNKLESHKYPSSKYFQERVGKYIVKHYRPSSNDSSTRKGDDVTFPEFVQYLLAEGHEKRGHNEHWRPIVQMCYPCAISYNVIGKYESLVEDSDMVLSMINASNLMFPMTRTANTSNKLLNYFRQLSIETIDQLYKMYELDFKLFGYNLENVIGYEIG